MALSPPPPKTQMLPQHSAEGTSHPKERPPCGTPPRHISMALSPKPWPAGGEALGIPLHGPAAGPPRHTGPLRAGRHVWAGPLRWLCRRGLGHVRPRHGGCALWGPGTACRGGGPFKMAGGGGGLSGPPPHPPRRRSPRVFLKGGGGGLWGGRSPPPPPPRPQETLSCWRRRTNFLA